MKEKIEVELVTVLQVSFVLPENMLARQQQSLG